MVVWRCHVGLDQPERDRARSAWEFLRPYVEPADAYVFSRAAVRLGGPRPRAGLDRAAVDRRLLAEEPGARARGGRARSSTRSGSATADGSGAASFIRDDGTAGAGRPRGARSTRTRRSRGDAPLVTQVSRWDRLKDPVGVLRAFAEHARRMATPTCCWRARRRTRSPTTPRAPRCSPRCSRLAEQLGRTVAGAASTSPACRWTTSRRTRRWSTRSSGAPTIVVQKSLAEGFGLTVAEAMWKARPVVASRLGGIQDQIVDGESGILLDDPPTWHRRGGRRDCSTTPSAPPRLGAAARQAVEERFLGTRSLIQYLELLSELLDREQPGA